MDLSERPPSVIISDLYQRRMNPGATFEQNSVVGSLPKKKATSILRTIFDALISDEIAGEEGVEVSGGLMILIAALLNQTDSVCGGCMTDYTT